VNGIRGKAGGVCDNKGETVPGSVRFLNNYKVVLTEQIAQPCPAVYMGNLWNHYGHFLMETLSRFWIFLDDNSAVIPPNAVFVFTPVYCKGPSDVIMTIIAYIRARLGVQDNVVFRFMRPGEQQRFSTVYLPDRLDRCIFATMLRATCEQRRLRAPGSASVCIDDLSGESFDLHHQLFTCISPSVTPNGPELLYMSRQGFARDPGSDIESAMQSLGFTIFSPQLDAFVNNLIVYGGVKVLVGGEGSGMHNSAFCPSSTTVIVLTNDARTPSSAQCYFDCIAKRRHIAEVSLSLGTSGVVERIKYHMEKKQVSVMSVAASDDGSAS